MNFKYMNKQAQIIEVFENYINFDDIEDLDCLGRSELLDIISSIIKIIK